MLGRRYTHSARPGHVGVRKSQRRGPQRFSWWEWLVVGSFVVGILTATVIGATW